MKEKKKKKKTECLAIHLNGRTLSIPSNAIRTLSLKTPHVTHTHTPLQFALSFSLPRSLCESESESTGVSQSRDAASTESRACYMASQLHSLLLLLLLLTLAITIAAGVNASPKTTKATPLSQAVLAEVAQALQAAGGSGGSGPPVARRIDTYFAASLLLQHYLRPLTRTRITLLLPTDAVSSSSSAAAMPLLSAMPPAQLRSLARFHMIPTNLTFANLLALPKSTLLPTLLGDAYRLRIDSATTPSSSSPSSVSAANFLIEGAHIIHPDICPPSLSHIVTCHGIDRLLLLASSSAPITPTNPSAAPAPASAPLPLAPSADLLDPLPSPDSSSTPPPSLPTTAITSSYANPSTSRHIDAYTVVNGSYTAAAASPPSKTVTVTTSTSLPSATADAIGSIAAAFSPTPAPLTASSAARAPLPLSQLLLLTLAGLVAAAATAHTGAA